MRRTKAADPLFPVEQRVAQAESQLADLRGGSASLPRISAWDDSDPREFIGLASAIAEGDYINFTRPVNTPYLVINVRGGLMNIDYVADTAGRGTHTTLASAVAAAITAASTNGEKTIWVCQSVTEGNIDIGGLGSGATITIASHSRYTVIITATAGNDIFTQTTGGGGTAGRLIFREVGLAPVSDKAVLHVNTTTEVRVLGFESCDFTQGGSYLLRQESTVNLGNVLLRIRDCTGTLAGFYDVAGSSAALGPDHVDAFNNVLTLTSWWDGGSANASPDVTWVRDGQYTITNGITLPNNLNDFHWSDLVIHFAGDEALFTWGASSNQGNDWSFQNIVLRTTNASGNFLNIGAATPGSAAHDNIFIQSIFGYSTQSPSGTFITVDTDCTNVHVDDIHAPEWSTLYSGPATDLDGLHYHSLLRDDDNDTLIQVEESSDEDTIRFDIGGTERMTLDGTKLDLLNSTYLDAADVQLPLLGSPTFTHVEHLNTVYHSSGWISGGNISDVESGNVTIAAGTGAIRSANTTTSQLLFFDWPQLATQAITANTIRYVGVELNDPNDPQVVIRTTNNFNNNTDFMLGTVVNESGTLHVQNAPWKIGDHASAMIQRARGVMPIARDKAVGGLIFSETGTRNVVVSTGALWHGLTSFTIGAIDTNPGGAADTFDTYSADGRKATGVAAWPNEQYDDGDATLQDMGASKWANLWWYLELDSELVMVYGTAQYTSAAKAGEEAAPSTLPDRLVVHGTLAARFIFQKSAGTAEEILSAFDTPFAVLGVTDHGNLAGLGDPDHPHDILDGSFHSDSVADGVTAGSIIIGNDTPKWDELVITIPAANVRNVLGIDNAETVPAWKTALDGTAPAALAAGASAGTSLVFSHRDHVHPYHASHGVTHNAVHGPSKHTEGNAWKVLYLDTNGDETELALGADGTFLQANGVAAAPTFAALVVGDVPYDDGTSDPLIDGDAAADGTENSPTRKDHVHPKHHAKYTGAEAVTAVEAEDPLNLGGVVNFAKNLNLTKGTSANIDGNDEIAVPAVSWLYLTSAGAADNLDGIGAGTEGQVVLLTVVAGKDITLVHDGAVTAGKKLMINGEANVVLNQDHDMAIAVYDATATVWNVLAVPGAAGHAEDHKDRHDPEDGADPLDSANAAEISVVVAAGTGTSHSLARADHIHAINHAITDNHLVTVDGPGAGAPANGEYAKWTAFGLEGKTFAEVLSDLGSQNFPGWADTGITGAELETLSDTSDADALHAHTNHGVTHIAAHAILDGSVHSDSVADGVTAGSIIIGNGTPKWDELVIAVPAANVRNVLGIDNAETLPSWKTALDGTNPADIAAAASPGTSLVFAHRDHVHAHPDLGDLHTGYFLASGARAMTGDINLDGNNIDNGGVIFLKEQAAADADVPGSGQIWVKSGAPNTLYFTDEDGTDVQLGAGGAGGGNGTIWAQGHHVTGSGTVGAARFGYAYSIIGSASADGTLFISMRIPSDFNALTKAVICCIARQTGTLRYSVANNFDADGIAAGTTTDSIAATDRAMTAGQLDEIDVSAAFTGLAADDIVGFAITRAGSHANDTITEFGVMGLAIEYTI